VVHIISNGVPDKLMPAWSEKFDAPTINALASYVLSMRDDHNVPPPGVLAAESLNQDLQKRITEGKRSFMVHCIECHGNGGRGGMGPNLTDEFTLHGGKVENFASTITNGVPDAGMPRWGSKLDSERIGALAEYIFSITGSRPTGKNPGTKTSRLVNSKYMRPRLNQESLKSGKRTFVVHCEQCHGLGGRGGAGPNLTDEFTLHG
jgi:mono/diheme cytochrome c family protein